MQAFEETYPQLYRAYLKEKSPSYQHALQAIQEGKIDSAFSDMNHMIEEDLFGDEVETDENFKTLHEKERFIENASACIYAKSGR